MTIAECIRGVPRGVPLGAIAMAAMAACGGAHAVSIDVGQPDVAVRFDNSVRYNLGVRAQKRNDKAYNTTTYDESDSKFSQGDIVTNRLDLLSELDAVYRKRFGARLSGAAWFDQSYHNTGVSTNPAFTVAGLGDLSASYPGNQYTSYVKRWNRGPSGELLDAFVFGGIDLGSVPVDVKLGRHNVYWGESLFSFVHGVSYSQGPVDIRKAFTNPGVQAKELFLPLTQVSAQAQLASNVTVAGQYFFDWKPSRIPDGGTYLGLADYFTAGGGSYVINPTAATAAALQFGLPAGAIAPVPFAGTPNKPKNHGDWGLKASWRPDFLDGTLGFYYREYTDKLPQIVAGGLQPGLPIPTDVRFTYLENNKLYGVSLAKEIAGVSVGSELTYRKNTGLLMAGSTTAGSEPRGDVWLALVNAIALVPKTPLFDSASITAELTYSRLAKVTANPTNFNSVGAGYGCPTNDKWDGCATRSNLGLAVKLEPVWYQPIAGMDLSMPIVYSVGVKGNSPVLFGGYQGNGSYSLGLNADVLGKYNVGLNYNGYLVRYKTTPNALGQPSIGAVNGIGYIGDRGWVSLTVKASF